jgi:membrane protein insertase Oxa1/YidC/SpoIIIJ
MKPLRLTIFLLLLLYHAIFVGIALNGDWTWISTNTQTVVWITIIGFVLFLTIFLMGLADRRAYQKKIAKLEVEKDQIKAKVYDIQRRNEEIDDSIKSFEDSLEKKDKNQNKS